jgi:UDP-hydrolysing UDP-N-acetyl-D-glucosamine 2-epimerase
MRKIAVFTGSRAEYGLQYPILRAIAADPRLEYFLLAGGTHLAQHFGRTMYEIEADGFEVYGEVKVPVRPASMAYTAQSIADVIQTVSCILSELQPAFLLVYADRFESFAAVIAASQMNIPVAHVEGGDYTEGGALDDSVRHAMTKLAHLHFTTNAQAADRVLRLGEESWRVQNVGLPALDLARAGVFAQPAELIGELGLDLQRPIVLFCQHSISTEHHLAIEQLQPSLEALKTLAAEGFQAVITYPNNDAGGASMIRELEALAEQRIAGIQVVKNLGRRRFHGMLHLMGKAGRGVLVGNSSAGVKETPAFGCPCVNIGSRQCGRLRAANVIDVDYHAAGIAAAIRRSVTNPDFRELCAVCENPYGGGNAGRRIAQTLATVPIGPELLRKKLTY